MRMDGMRTGSAAAVDGITCHRPAPQPRPPHVPQTPRERNILRGIARGASNKEIGTELGIAETTVKIHVQHVLRKLDVSTRVLAAGWPPVPACAEHPSMAGSRGAREPPGVARLRTVSTRMPPAALCDGVGSDTA